VLLRSKYESLVHSVKSTGIYYNGLSFIYNFARHLSLLISGEIVYMLLKPKSKIIRSKQL